MKPNDLQNQFPAGETAGERGTPLWRSRLRRPLHAADVRLLAAQAEAAEGLDALFRLLSDADLRVARRAAWVLTHCRAARLSPFADRQEHVEALAMQTADVTLRRLLLTLLDRLPGPSAELHVAFLDFCLDRLLAGQETTGVRSVCMRLAYRQCGHSAELLRELETVLDSMEEDRLSAGLRSSRNRILKNLRPDRHE